MDREEENEVKKMISLWKKQGKVVEGKGVILTRREPSGASAPTHYSITASTCHSIAHQAPFGAQNRPKPRVAFQLRGKEKGWGNDAGPTCQQQQTNCVAFSISIYCFITWCWGVRKIGR
jgi:hypothetical protein